MLRWCENYLANRAYVVKVNTQYSEKVNVTEGTAQGSVLGPLHYLAYVNDLQHIISKSQLFQYADDTCLVAADTDIKTAVKNLQCDYDLLCKWSHDVGLVINSQKTKLLHICSSHNRVLDEYKIISHDHDCMHRNNITCNCKAIEKVEEHLYLGVIMDKRFNWDRHIEYICNKLRLITAKLYLVKNKLHFKSKLQLYTSLMDSIIAYGLSSYGRTFKTHLNKIYNIQLKTLKMIAPSSVRQKFYHNEFKLFQYCKVLPIQDKVKHILLKEHFFHYNRNYKEHKILTRSISNNTIETTRANNFYGKRTLNYIIPRLINEVPKTLKDKITINNIKYKIKDFFFSNY